MRKNSTLIVAWILYSVALSALWYLRVQNVVSVGLAVAGSLVGFLLPIVLDVLLPKIIDGSAKADTTFAKDILTASANQLKQGNVHSLDVTQTPLRSYPLLLAYFAATIFIITSTQNWFGRGFVLGLGFSLISDIYISRAPVSLRDRWFSVFKTNLSDVELRYFTWIIIAVFGVISLIAAVV